MVAGRELERVSFTRYGKNHLVRAGEIETLCHIKTRKAKAPKPAVRICVRCRKISNALALAAVGAPEKG